ncbi:MAG: hypothetical protein HOV73_01800 [Streptomyces sp.]|nr:hypothetical protein [Streptomyces sp.]
MEFQDELAGGIFLIRPALRSPDYVAGVSGWTINVDGSAEFNDVVIRGDLSSSNYVAGVSGWHLDDAGSAEFNDVVIRGDGSGDVLVIGPSTGPQVRVGSEPTFGYINLPTNRPLENQISTILSGVGNTGAANEYLTLQVFGPTLDAPYTARSYALFNSQSADGSTNAVINLKGGASSVILEDQYLVLQGAAQARFITTASANTSLTIEANGATTGSLFRALKGGTNKFEVTNAGRALVTPDAVATTALLVNTAAGYTGNLFQLQVNGTSRFGVTADGTALVNVAVADALPAIGVDTLLAHTGALLQLRNDGNEKLTVDTTGTITKYSSWTTFTPTWNNVGTATFSTNVGWYKRVDDVWLFEIYAVASAAGSGTTNVTISGLPFTPFRAGAGAATTRQRVGAYIPGVVAGTNSSVAGAFNVTALAGGAALTLDNLSGPTAISLRGENIGGSFIATIQGWMRAV